MNNGCAENDKYWRKNNIAPRARAGKPLSGFGLTKKLKNWRQCMGQHPTGDYGVETEHHNRATQANNTGVSTNFRHFFATGIG